jgi:HlyD family secretion protein
MKKILIISGIVVAIIALIVFNKMISKKEVTNIYAEVKKGIFEITVTNAGELIAEQSLDIKGPELGQSSDQNNNQGGNQGRGSGGNQGRGSRGGSIQGGSRMGGSDMRAMDFKIQDIVPEGTIVKKGDYIAQLDRTNYENTLKDELENLTTVQNNANMKILDTAMTLTSLRDGIKNQRYQVEEAGITLDQSKFEPPATIRQAELNLNKEKRALEQLQKSYTLRRKQTIMEINNQKQQLEREEKLVKDLQEFLSGFTIKAPSDGMVIYKKDRNGTKRKAGSSINAFDRTVATLPDLSTLISKMYVNEIDVSKIKPGQHVNITVDAFPQKAYTGSVTSVANIGEQLPNSDAKMFEVLIKIDNLDPELRPAMTTWNKIVLKTIDNALYIPLECVRAGADSIPFVYKKNKTRQIVRLGEQNDKNVIVEEGLDPGTSVYQITPEEPGSFKLVGQNLIPSIKHSR